MFMHKMLKPGYLTTALVSAVVLGAGACTVQTPTTWQTDDEEAVLDDVVLDNEVDEPSADAAPEAGPAGGVLVSPELFDLVGRWAAESSELEEESRIDLETYAKLHAPDLSQEAADVLRLSKPAPVLEDLAGTALVIPCTCKVYGTFDKPSASLSGSVWSLNVKGAAHKGKISQSGSGTLKENTSNGAIYTTKFRTRMNCVTQAGTACSGGCSAKLYADVGYSTQLSAYADTGGIWSKGATGQVVDAVTLDLRLPFNAPATRLFEKGASVSHEATKKTYDVNALATLVKSGLSIATAIAEGSGIEGKLVDDTLKALFGLVHKSGANGTTSQGMNVDYETAFAQPITVSYVSEIDQYYGLDLSSSVRLKARGYGGWHKAVAETASSYSMAVYFNNFACDPGVTPPPVSGFWRYDAYDGAPMTVASVQDRVRNFFYLVYGTWVNVSSSEGALEQGLCGDLICSALETDFTCPGDCIKCGDAKCSSPVENVSNCPGDCGYCGDGYCSSIETLSSCPGDCGYCGDGYCGGFEDCYSCSGDCGPYCW